MGFSARTGVKENNICFGVMFQAWDEWNFQLYDSVKGRKRGILNLQRNNYSKLIYTFEIEVREILKSGTYIPNTGRYDSRRTKEF